MPEANVDGDAGTANTGGGGGGGGLKNPPAPEYPGPGGAGGSGLVVVRSQPGDGVLFTTCSPTNAPVTTTDGLNQIAQFKASGTLNIIDSSPSPTINEVDYLVIGGGGAAAGNLGGGGAGGYRTSFPGGTKLKLQPGPHAITIGAGGARTTPGTPDAGVSGSPSVAGAIVSTGGGAGIRAYAPATEIANAPGGSGGGGASNDGTAYGPGGDGNFGNTSPPEGNPGGSVPAPASTGSSWSGAGGGGSGGAGANGSGSGAAGAGGSSTTSCITG